MAKFFIGLLSIFPLLFGDAIPSSRAQVMAPAPAPASYGNAIDQGIACVLMLVALVLTYLIHPLDASASDTFFRY